ncbi:MAG: hypothetical protein ABI806_03855, partial [Candidatus Solibacter sp.]
MKPPRPSAIMTLAGQKLTGPEAGLYWLRVRLARGSHDQVELSLWPRTKFASAQPGDTLTLQLGLMDAEEDVWSGEVTRVEQTAQAVLITGHSATAALSRERKAQTYVGQKVGDIVRDLASPVAIDEVKADTELSYYSVDHGRSVWGHLVDLADLSGCELSCSASGGLRFVPVNSLPSATKFRYGAELLSWRLGPSTAGKAVTFAAHGSASESGSEKWHWVNPDPTTGKGGSQVVGGFHSRSAADALSQATEDRVKRAAVSGEIELTGQATLRPGDVFSLSDL